MEKLTVFTPTYNRGYILPKLYNSLINQTNKEFVWLIVDDGSADNTKELISKWQKENKIKIEYIYQKNGGKMRAHNNGVRNCKTDLFVCVDSDDYLVDNAIELILNNADKLENRGDLSGIVAYRGVTNKEVIGNYFPKKIIESSLGNLYRKGFKGDTTLIFKTSILRGYVFPEIEGEKFITEDYIYCQIDEKYKMLVLPEILIICEYREDGYTKNAIKLIIKNPIGMLNYYNLKIKLAKSLKEKAEYTVRYSAISRFTKQKKVFKNCKSKFLYILTYPVSIIYYHKKKKLLN